MNRTSPATSVAGRRFGDAPMNSLLRGYLARAIKQGRLEIIDSAGAAHRFGDGSGTPVRIRFKSAAAERALLLDPEMKLGEEYMNGGYAIETGTVLDFVTLLYRNIGSRGQAWWMRGASRLRRRLRQLLENNNSSRARRNVHGHYDLDSRLYDLVLDEDRQYSCAYFEEGVTDLDQAQAAKKRHLAAKLDLKPGQRVLDIGSGWGGLGIYLAENFGVDVTGVTLSDEQFTLSNQRAEQRGLARRARFLNRDYRALEGTFDRIVSVGMFEHVGLSHYREFFRHVDRLLEPDGIALIHTIAKRNDPAPINPWMQRYIFPGAYLPALSELAPRIEQQGFWLTDLEIWRLHYAETLAAWNRRFQARRAEAAAIYDERFCRMWEFYLQVCEFGFREQGLCVFQFQLAKNAAAVPLTRDYIYDGTPRANRHDRPLAVSGRR
ncbi:MAG TPA: cyclopropane-fatty-acyl-phospholipid synthase family protein [Bauldia sp.]